jgi:hypothetical protein
VGISKKLSSSSQSKSVSLLMFLNSYAKLKLFFKILKIKT